MSKASKNLLKLISLVILLALVSCTRVNQANFEQVKPGMNMAQVVKILGEPSSVDSINIAGISGSSASWKNHHATIVIQFFNDQVAIKTFSKSGQNGSQQNTDINLPTGSGSDNTDQ